MILMCVFPVVSEHNVRRDRLQLFECGFNFRADEGQESVAEFFCDRAFEGGLFGEQFGSAFCFRATDSACTEYNPMKHTSWVLDSEPENCASATDLDVVRV